MSLARFLAPKNLRADRFASLCMVLGVALGTATVNVVLALDLNTRQVEAPSWATNPDLAPKLDRTVSLRPIGAAAEPAVARDARAADEIKEETHEDYQVMRSAIRLGSLSAFLVGALIVFFSLAVVVEHRYREVALLRSLGATARQTASVFVREAAWVGALGALLGFLLAIPMTYVAAKIGITTTGRARISSLALPWTEMLLVSAVGGLTALLGVVPPVRRILGLRAPDALRPRFLEQGTVRAARRKASGVTLIALPFGLLVYGLMRPLVQEVLPSLAFFVLEAVLVLVAVLMLLVLVPDLTRVLGGLLARAFLHGPAAARLLLVNRIRRQGHDLAWSVSGITLVFALLLALHISTKALKNEVTRFSETAMRPYAFVFTEHRDVPPELYAALPPEIAVTRYSGHTPMPNAVSAVARADLVAFARGTGRPDLIAMAERLDQNGVILSELLAGRLGLAPGQHLELSSPAGKRELEVVGVTDELGFVPKLATYRQTKTYALVEAANYPLLEPFALPIGAAAVLSDSRQASAAMPQWWPTIRSLPKYDGVYVIAGVGYAENRRWETNRDFFIFDLILLLTSVLAGVGVANQLVLAVHARRGEIALLRVLGMTAAQIRKLLWLEGGFVGLLGGTLAVAAGIPLGFASLAALSVVSTFDVHFDLPPHYVIATLVGAVGLSLLASLYPARRAAGARSAEFTHYE